MHLATARLSKLSNVRGREQGHGLGDYGATYPFHWAASAPPFVEPPTLLQYAYKVFSYLKSSSEHALQYRRIRAVCAHGRRQHANLLLSRTVAAQQMQAGTDMTCLARLRPCLPRAATILASSYGRRKNNMIWKPVGFHSDLGRSARAEILGVVL